MWNIFRGILGFPKNPNTNSPGLLNFESNEVDETGRDNPGEDRGRKQQQHNIIQPSRPSMVDQFPAFSNPVEIHRYFEQQMDELLKGLIGFHNFSPFEQENEFHTTSEDSNPSDLRDSFLKPGVTRDASKSDSDFDGQVGSLDIEHLLERLEGVIEPSVRPIFFSQSVTIRTVSLPDGSTETVRTVRDQDGREETTVTRGGPIAPTFSPDLGP